MTVKRAGAFEDLRNGRKMVHTSTGRLFRSHHLSYGEGRRSRKQIADL